jgi:putative transposase
MGGWTSDPFQFRVVADYIHLNPARAGLAGGTNGKLVVYEWNSLPGYQREKGPPWLVFDRVMAAFELAQDGRGWRAYVNYLEKRASENGGNFSDAAMAALRGGWYLGDETFRDQLLGLIEKGSKLLSKKGSYATAAVNGHGERKAERMVVRGLEAMGLANNAGKLIQARKGDPRKVALAAVAKAHTS